MTTVTRPEQVILPEKSELREVPSVGNAPPSGPASRTTWWQMRQNWYAYVLLVPTFLLLILFMYYPAILALVKSLYRWSPPIHDEFIGLANFRRILADDMFWKSWRNLGIIAIWTFTVPFAMPIVVAEAILNLKSHFAKRFYQAVILIPTLVPGMVSLQLWRWLYTYPNGGINLLLKQVGMGQLARPWLNTIPTALPAILFMGFPWIVGSAPLVYLAGLMNISQDVLDAAVIDGCSLFRRVIFIDIPYIMGQVRLFLIFGIIGLFQQFGTQMIMTDGGPRGSTMVPGLYLYKRGFGTERFEVAFQAKGEACAVGVILFALILIFTVLGRRLTSSDIEVD